VTAAMARTAADLLSLAEDGVRYARRAGADEAEVCVMRTRGASVTLQKNDVHSAATEDETVVGVRALRNGSAGFATTNEPDRLAEAAAEAVALARCAPPDPRNGFADPERIEPLNGLLDPALEDVDVAALVDVAAEMLARVRDRDPRVRVDSGGTSAERVSRAVANSRGVRAAEESSAAGGSLFGMAVDGTDVGSFDAEGDVVRRAADLRTSLAAAADRFVVKTLGALGAASGESFKGAVIFTPEVVAEFVLGNLASVLSAKSVRVGKSPFADKLHQAIADRRFTLRDDPRRAELSGATAFDREGIPARARALIEGGVLKTFLYDAFEARAAAVRPTGHARGGAGSSPAIGPWNLELERGDTPFAAMCGEPARAVLVSRFSGSTSAVTGEFSGVVKGGFLFKKGERFPVKEVQIAGNLYELLRRLSAVSAETRTIDGSTTVPALRFDDVSVTAG
jgi:PmbA protein